MVFLTPTYPPDFGRLKILRESMRRYEITDDHLILVDRRDLEQARAEFSGPGVQVLDKAELSPGFSRHLSQLPTPVAKRMRAGWWQQQFAKLNAGRALGLSRWLCLDSDTFFMAHMGEADFVSADGRTHLVERIDASVGRHVRQANLRSSKILRLGESRGGTDTVWTGQCVPFDARVIDELLDWMSEHYPTPWWATMMLRGGTEYALYGMFARYIHQLKDVEPNNNYLASGIYKTIPVPEAARFFTEDRAKTGVRLAMVHSHLDYTDAQLMEIARLSWDAVSE